MERVRALLRMRMKQAGAANMRLVVIVDQMEELFTMCTDERQPHIFLDMISRLTSNSPCGQEPVAVAAYGLRADFYPHCTEYLQLRTALQGGQVILGPMSPEELRAAILNPAERAGLRVDPALVEVLLQELGATAAEGYEAGRLPLLAYALRAAWRERHGNTLTVEGYRLTGGIQNAVATTAERALTSLNHAEQQVARMLFLQLVKIGEGTEDTRRRVAHKDLLSGGVEQQTMSRVLDEFTRARLITQGQDTVQITHETLLRAWPTLCSWIDDDRPGNLIRQQLNEAAAQWNHDKRDAGALYRGTRLQAARDWMSSQPQQHDLPPTAAAFLSASIRNERRDTRRRRRTLAALSFLTVISLIASVIAVWQLNTAQAARDDAIINQINAQADRLRGSDVSGTDPSLAAQLKLTVYRKRNNDPNLYTSLISAENVPLSTLLTGHTHGINSVVFSPDGKTLASGSNDHTVQLWHIIDPARPTPLGRYTNSQDRNIISLALARTARHWPTATTAAG
ncbi:WD40 repeat domain-containing protein [Nonomuraea fuscirosea]|uniref:WD40 repeat domain-containing protein n=1 Tax=Nonomuraea fuscirosea TaxID=1291556 RepID=UPI003441593E